MILLHINMILQASYLEWLYKNWIQGCCKSESVEQSWIQASDCNGSDASTNGSDAFHALFQSSMFNGYFVMKFFLFLLLHIPHINKDSTGEIAP